MQYWFAWNLGPGFLKSQPSCNVLHGMKDETTDMESVFMERWLVQDTPVDALHRAQITKTQVEILRNKGRRAK